MMGIDVLETLPSPGIPYSLVDPFILVHEGVVPITPEWAGMDTKHPHRGFDNLWYLVSGSASTGHSTGPGGVMERARLQAGSLLKLRTGRGVWHAEGIGEDELREGKTEVMRGILFWVNLARSDKGVEPSAQLLEPEDVPVREEGDAIVRVLVGDGSPVELGTPGLILDVELPKGGTFTTPVPSDFNGFVYILEGVAVLGVTQHRVSRSQIAVLGPGRIGHHGRCAAGDTSHAHGCEAVRRGARLQRTVCRLMAIPSRHRWGRHRRVRPVTAANAPMRTCEGDNRRQVSS